MSDYTRHLNRSHRFRVKEDGFAVDSRVTLMLGTIVFAMLLCGCSPSTQNATVRDAVEAKPTSEVVTVTLYVPGMNQKLRIL